MMSYKVTTHIISANKLFGFLLHLFRGPLVLGMVLFAFSFFSLCYSQPAGISAAKKWVGTWSTAPQLVEPGNMPPSPGLTNSSLRQIVEVSIGGDTLRVKFSNEFSTSPVTMKSVQIAVSTGDSTIDTSTDKELKFNGNSEVIMDSGAAVMSDPIAFKLTPRMDVAITICYGQTSATVTGHPGSRTTSHIISRRLDYEDRFHRGRHDRSLVQYQCDRCTCTVDCRLRCNSWQLHYRWTRFNYKLTKSVAGYFFRTSS